jgi:hypothetical protein
MFCPGSLRACSSVNSRPNQASKKDDLLIERAPRIICFDRTDIILLTVASCVGTSRRTAIAVPGDAAPAKIPFGARAEERYLGKIDDLGICRGDSGSVDRRIGDQGRFGRKGVGDPENGGEESEEVEGLHGIGCTGNW